MCKRAKQLEFTCMCSGISSFVTSAMALVYVIASYKYFSFTHSDFFHVRETRHYPMKNKQGSQDIRTVNLINYVIK